MPSKAFRKSRNRNERAGGEQTEIAAQVAIPHDSGWRWMVVFGAFFNIFILDGVTFTFGCMLPDMKKELQMPDSLIALINSVAVALYFLTSPFASALINKFGFRECAMTGSIVCCFSLLFTYFVTQYWVLFIFYGIIAGMGYSLINMSSGLVVGFYFEKCRAVAMAIATCGSSCGVMIMFPLNDYFVKLAGWRATTLLHSGLFGIIFFLGMTFRPLITFTITKTDEDATRVTTYMPSVTSTATTAMPTPSYAIVPLVPTATERMFKAISNVNFPTAAEVVKEDTTTASMQPGTSTSPVTSKLTLIASQQVAGISQRQLKQIQSIISRTSTQVSIDLVHETHKEDTVKEPSRSSRIPSPTADHGCCWRLFHWEPHETTVRPLYRDDIFYEGDLQNLATYQKSKLDTTSEGKIGLEYHMAVTRVAAMTDLQERRGIYTTAIRRVLATMMDPKLLHRRSFLMLCCSGFMIYLGFLVPYIYLPARNKKAGIEARHCSLFVSTIGLSNAVGRLTLGLVASRIDPLKMFSFWCCIAGISTIASGLSYNLYYQYTYCCVFGFSISSAACLRSLSLVNLYGLDKLTNATGMMLIFLGLGNLISTPLAGLLKNKFGYNVAFMVAGSFITVGALVLIPVKTLAIRENKCDTSNSTSNLNFVVKQTGITQQTEPQVKLTDDSKQ